MHICFIVYWRARERGAAETDDGREGNVQHTRIYMKINHRYVAVKFIGFMLINLTIFNLLFAFYCSAQVGNVAGFVSPV